MRVPTTAPLYNVVFITFFRKKDIGDAKEGKRKFDRQTTKFCTQLEKYCSLTTKKNDATLQVFCAFCF